jgi:hypothetical protein
MGLGSVVAIEEGGTDAFPFLGLLRGHETVLTTGGSTVRDAQVSINIVQDVALNLTVLGLGNGDIITNKQTLTVLLDRLVAATGSGDHHCGNKQKE